jgi:hypothetical protein
MSLSSVCGTVYKHLHTLPKVTVWLDCPRFGCLAWDFRVRTLMHTAAIISTCMMDKQHKYIYILITSIKSTLDCQMDLLFSIK